MMRKIEVFRIIFFCCGLLLVFPTLHAQVSASELLEWTEQYLNKGDCDKAQETYKLYKEKVPTGNAEVERRIAECGTPAQTIGNNKTDLTFKVGDVTFKMIFVKGGTFQMGNDSGEGNERPVHNVTVSDFYMGEFEVTQALWQEVMGTTIYQQRDKTNISFVRAVGANYPMYYVNHTEAEEFCRCLNQRLRSQLPDGFCIALPTEAEWEYAARGGSKSKGYTYSGSYYLLDVGWYGGNSSDNSSESTRLVGLKKANELGLYDMSGNVEEWCSDWYESYGSSSQTDPRGAYSSMYCVVRGGCWASKDLGCRVFARTGFRPSSRGDIIGFRIALVRR